MEKEMPIVHIVEDDETLRDYFADVLGKAGLAWRGFESAESFLGIYEPRQPGCLLLDVRLPGMGGAELQQRLNLLGAPLPVIFLTGHGDVRMAVEAMRHGAFDFIEKTVTAAALVAQVRKALEYDAQQRVAVRSQDEMLLRFETLTGRERDVLMLLISGRSNKAIASELRLSLRTVELHRARVMQKTGSRSLAQLIRMAVDVNFAHHPRTGARSD